jgi:4-hydroxybenzoate polyprenyltransferase/tetratricopeptide (TPR) repeat protein
VSIGFLRKLIIQVENQRMSWFSTIFTLFSVILLRNFLEGILEEAHSITLLENIYHSLLINFVHFFSFYLTLFLLVIILLAYITRERFRTVATTVVLFSPIILIAPIADLIISRGAGFNLSYPTALDNLRRLIITGPFYRGTIAGITPGMRIEFAIAALLVLCYVYGKGKGIIKAIVSFITFDLIIIVVANAPLIITLASGKSFTQLYEPGSLLSSDTQKFGIIYLILLSCTLAFAGVAFLPRFMKTWFRSIRYLRSINYVSTVIIGFLIGYAIAGKLTPFLFDNPWDYLAIASLCISIFLSFCGSVVFNDICDVQSDAVSRKRNPLVSKKVERNHYLLLGVLLYFLALLFAANTSYTAFFLVLILVLLSFFYSSPPFRLKRLPLISTFILSFATFCSIMLGFSLFAGSKAFSAFPSKLTILFLVSLTFGFTPKDLADIEGDRQNAIYTIPVICGQKAGKIITYVLVCVGYLLVPLLFRSSLLLMLSLSFIIITGLQFLIKEVRESLFLITYYTFSICVVAFLLFHPEMLTSKGVMQMGKRFQAEYSFGRRQYQEVYDHFSHGEPFKDTRLLVLTGISAFKVRDYERALEFLQPALDADPYHSDVYSYVTNALISIESGATEANRLNGLALERWLDPKRFIAEKGIIFFHLGSPDTALEYLTTAYRLGYDESSLLFYLARVLHLQRKTSDSERLLLTLLDRRRDDVAALAELGKIRMETGQLNQAIKLFQQALAISTQSPSLHNDVGVCYLKLGDYKRAATYFENALQINPHYLPAKRNLQMLREVPSNSLSPASTAL